MQDGVERMLEVDSFTEAICGNQHAASFQCQLVHFCPPLLVADPASDRHDPDFGVSSSQGFLKPVGHVVGSRDVAAPDDGMKAVAEKLRYQISTFGKLRIVGGIEEFAGHRAEFTQLPPIGVIQRLLGRFERRSWLVVVGPVVG